MALTLDHQELVEIFLDPKFEEFVMRNQMFLSFDVSNRIQPQDATGLWAIPHPTRTCPECWQQAHSGTSNYPQSTNISPVSSFAVEEPDSRSCL